MAKILIVDDDRSCATLLARFLTDKGYETQAVLSGHDALNLGNSFVPDLLVSDWLLQDGLDGVVVARTLRDRHPTLKIMFITGLPREQLQSKITDLGKSHILEKPLDILELLSTIHGLLDDGAK